MLVSVWDLGWSNSCDLLYPGRACFVSGSAVDLEVLVVWDYEIHVTYCISRLVAALFNAKNSDSVCLLVWDYFILFYSL